MVGCSPRFRWRTQTDEQRKYAILFAATILAARKLNERCSRRLVFSHLQLSKTAGLAFPKRVVFETGLVAFSRNR